ncbi:DUF3667 domain-containing protein [Aquimarina sp. 2201CG14-23]|uniref:DUF3667 domain-containing protein n=1 Tax=Aquimarina mycalae TaxID=3040073 RepID=UPI00247828BF|nr:DUF3667 domain-containing protein [Aquimarina sp. 2201CG14-23]MDH7445964.1 DUF3667 domain-containing protein [Aquimarina sp. 2201CG14-23]
MICVSCNTEHNANFCPNCGEKSEIKKITFKSIIEDTFLTITNMDKGFLYNLKMLFMNPKSIANEYILGKRKGILNPISFLIFSVTMYLIIENLLRVPRENTELQNLPDVYLGKVAYAAGKYVHVYLKYFWILSIVPLAISTKLIFRKYNFIEHLAINSFILGQATLIGVISYIILKIDLPVNPLVYLLIVWLMYRIFMTENNKLETFLMSVGALVLFVLQLVIIATGIGIIMA